MAILGRTRPRPRSHGESELGELPDLEDLGAAVRARALNSRATVLHRDLLRILDLDLLAFLDAVALRHRGPPFEPIPRIKLEHPADRRGHTSAKCNYLLVGRGRRRPRRGARPEAARARGCALAERAGGRLALQGRDARGVLRLGLLQRGD